MFLEKNRREVEKNCSASSRGCKYDINSRLLRLARISLREGKAVQFQYGTRQPRGWRGFVVENFPVKRNLGITRAIIREKGWRVYTRVAK